MLESKGARDSERGFNKAPTHVASYYRLPFLRSTSLLALPASSCSALVTCAGRPSLARIVLQPPCHMCWLPLPRQNHPIAPSSHVLAAPPSSESSLLLHLQTPHWTHLLSLESPLSSPYRPLAGAGLTRWNYHALCGKCTPPPPLLLGYCALPVSRSTARTSCPTGVKSACVEYFMKI
jgi:hypothetical protein